MVTEIDQLLRAREVWKMLGISEGSLYKLLREGKFPQPIRLGGQMNRWRKSTVEQWINEQPQ